jgi:hypothetical protein
MRSAVFEGGQHVFCHQNIVLNLRSSQTAISPQDTILPDCSGGWYKPCDTRATEAIRVALPQRVRCPVKEPLVTILPARHRLARHKTVRPQDICREDFISTARAAPVLKTVIEEYATKIGIKLKQISMPKLYLAECRWWPPQEASHCCQSMYKIR